MIAEVRVYIKRVVVAEAQVDIGAECLRNRCGDHIQRATGCAWPDDDRSGSFENLERIHAPLRREVVGRRRGVGRRRDQDAIFEQRDACTTVETGTANADVRAQPEAFFFLDVDTRHRAQHAQDVGVVEELERLAIDDMRRARHVRHIAGAADNRHRIDGLQCLVTGRFLAERGH